MVFFVAPLDYQQANAVRIKYVHVPAAWMATIIYAVITSASVAWLVWKNPVSDMIARNSAVVGAAFTAICLATGSLWGKPMWGAWWVWDARLTSVLALLFIYIAYIFLINNFTDRKKSSTAAAIFAIAGSVNLPIIKFSVDWWNTLHQPASILRIKNGGLEPAIHSSMLHPLLIMIAAFFVIYMLILWLNVKSEILERRALRKNRSGII
jgi:heme exporter protein C